jgi:SMODS-associating 4TM effector domain
MGPAMNEIASRENSDEFLRLMRARSQVYREAGWYQKAQLFLTVLVPLVAGLVGVFVPGFRPYAGAMAVIITLLDASFLDRQQRQRFKLAAKISEKFDTGVLDLPWNNFIGPPVEPELVERASRAWPKGVEKLRDWYAPQVSRAPIALGRILCQRSNLRYDCELRKEYGNILLWLAIAISVVLIVIGVLNNLAPIALVVTTLAPSSPILVWAVRERFRQIDTGLADDAMRGGVEKLWEQTSKRQIDEAESTARARTLQDAIFAHRSSSPLIFPFIYDRMRPKLEIEMHAGVDQLLRDAGYP